MSIKGRFGIKILRFKYKILSNRASIILEIRIMRSSSIIFSPFVSKFFIRFEHALNANKGS